MQRGDGMAERRGKESQGHEDGEIFIVVIAMHPPPSTLKPKHKSQVPLRAENTIIVQTKNPNPEPYTLHPNRQPAEEAREARG
jgi:hypothetical protein